MNEDSLAVIVGLALLALVLVDAIPGSRDPVTDQTTETRTEERSGGLGYGVAGVQWAGKGSAAKSPP